MVRLRGLEPLTYRSGICRSIQLSYRRIRHRSQAIQGQSEVAIAVSIGECHLFIVK
jgi:hypothetical protein